MYKVIFNYLSIDYPVECEKNEKIKDIYERCKSKINLNIENTYFLYKGLLLGKEQSFQEVANIQDKERKIINIIIVSVKESIVEQKKVRSKEIICSNCYENSFLNIKKYKINLLGCKNNHTKNNILLKDYEETQKIDISKISCSKCKNIKSKTFNNDFFICVTCNKNLCPLCKSIHEKGHRIISFEDKFYKCNKHAEPYSDYCKTCNLNICMSCIKEHINHNIINLAKIVPKKETLLNDILSFREIIDNFNNNLKELIKTLENTFKNVMDNMERYFIIYNQIIDNYEGVRKINYNIIQNIDEIKNYNNTIINDINEFVKEKIIINKINKIMKIYSYMNNENNEGTEKNIKKDEKIKIKKEENIKTKKESKDNKMKKEENIKVKKENKDNKPIKNNFLNISSKNIEKEKEKQKKVHNTEKKDNFIMKKKNVPNIKKPIITSKKNYSKESGYYDFNREIIFLHVGQAGIELGNAMWELFSIENGIGFNYIRENIGNDDPTRKIFTEAKNGNFYANSIFIDSDPTNIDKIENGHYKYLFEHESFISGNGSASQNYAKGYYTIGTNLVNNSMDRIRHLIENCSNLGGFVITNAVTGGTGSGCTSLLLENLCIKYDKKLRITFPIYPSPKLSNNINGPYNCVFSTHELLEFSDIAIVLDNEALFDISKIKLKIYKPSYINLNRLTAQIISSLINSENNQSSVNSNLNGLMDYLIPSPRLHFMLSSYSPILTAEIAYFEELSIKNITNYVFEPTSMLVKSDYSSLKRNKYIRCGLLYRGDVQEKDVLNYMDIFQTKKIYETVNMNPNLYKYNFSYRPPSVVPGGDLAKFMRDVCMISNHTIMNEFISKLNIQFDKMYNKKENIQLYLNEDMEEAEFKEARENLDSLVKEYKDFKD